jgi:anaerobic ribonucleoside-triphosphate reductase activating protein
MRLHGIIHGTRANGPGLRTCVWLRGCALSCPGCFNKDTHDFAGGREVEPEDLAQEIFRFCPVGTEGITVSGGEPLHQANSLYRLFNEIKSRRPDWSIGMFSGYSKAELESGNFHMIESSWLWKTALWIRICTLLDFAKLGRFDATKPVSPAMVELDPSLNLCSSWNQELVLFRRYQFSDFEPLSVEFNIAADGLTSITGYPI